MKARIAQVLLLSAAIVQAGAIAPMHAIRSQTSQGVPAREAASPASLSAGERKVWKVKEVDLAFRWVPPGDAVLGSPSSEPCSQKDERRWHAAFPKGLWMQETELTQDQWQAVMSANPSKSKGCASCPVEQVSWDDAQEFLRKLNGLVEGGGFRLPTEPEWEYAARGGGEGAFGLPCHDYIRRTCQDHPACLDEFAWYAANSDGKSHPAGQKKPNAWGLRDMHGNVWEWCEGWYGRYPDTFDKTVEWAGPEGGKTRVLRGGAWNSLPGSVRAAVRDFTAPSTRSKVIGFRCVKDS